MSLPTPVEHLIVLLLENRSFDHMLGFLDHPDPAYEGLTGEEVNYLDPTGPPTKVTPNATTTLAPDPGHSHESVMYQLTGKSRPRSPYVRDNSGFLRDFERKALEETGRRGLGKRIMRCQPADHLPVLSALAREYLVLDHWFCSVPGETWPNRNYAIAATSDGEVNIDVRWYNNPTIFEQLDDFDRSWAVYYDGFPQLLAFPDTWKLRWRRYHRSHARLLLDIAEGRLPNLAYVEPDHQGDDSNSQHPSNNAESGRDFAEGERLVAQIYNALIANPAVWERCAFLITYDEHGGFYDHVPPPQDPRYRRRKIHRDGAYRFVFDLLGPRVPAVLVSPYVKAGAVDSRTYEHSSIVRSARDLFMPGAPPLSDDSRDAEAASFVDDFSGEIVPRAVRPFKITRRALAGRELPRRVPLTTEPAEAMDGFQQSLLALAEKVEERLLQEEVARVRLTDETARLRARRPAPARILTAKDAENYQDHVVDLLRSSAR